MKKWVALLLVCIYANGFSQTNISPQFSELKGVEDQFSNTHLFYRIYNYFSNQYGFSEDNSIYHFVPATLVDSLFLSDYIYSYPMMEAARFVYDYDFWGESFSEYIFCGMIGFGPEPIAYIERFDGNTNYYQWGEVNEIDISKQNDSVIYAGGNILSALERSVRSTDGGWNWMAINDSLMFLSLNPFNENALFLEGYYGSLYRSTDSGNTFNLVDVLNQPAYSTSFLYDPDQLHIYRLFGNQTLRVSSNQGEPYSWQTKYFSDSEILISNDDSVSGTIYIANKRKIYVSDNYGDNFFPILTLESDIVGLYIKPYSKFLFAATQYRIYEKNLWEDSLKIIKSITPVSENYGWFPLNIGNYWVYSVYTSEGGQTIYWGDETRAIVDTQTSNPGSQVFVYQSKYVNGDVDTTYLKLDSLSGKLYATSSSNGDYLLFDDLTAEAGDTVCYEYNPAWNCQYVQLERDFTEFGINTLIKDYYPQAPGWYFGHSLVKGFGLYEVYNGDLTTFKSILKGCIINGIVYGDTTVVSVYDEENPIATEFKLEQNYPNPFNPSTKIKFSIPSVETRDRVSVLLKVYDVLGNEVVTLVNEELPAGEYEVELNTSSMKHLPASGIYFYQLKAGNFVETRKMVLIK